MTRRKLLGIGTGAWAVGLGVYAIALIVTVPATLLDAGLRRASEGRLRVAEARGTLWWGAGRMELRDPAGKAGIAEDVAWRAQPESLWRGRLVYEVRLARSARHFRLSLSPAEMEVADADIALPAATLGVAVPGLAQMGFTGDVRIHVSSLTTGRDGIRGHVALRWHGAGSALTPVSPLGTYELLLEAAAGTVQGRLRTLEGPLQLDGAGSWAGSGGPTFRATARVPQEYRHQLVPLLSMIAVEGPDDGHFELSDRLFQSLEWR
jgi:general secretion pathway protein N